MPWKNPYISLCESVPDLLISPEKKTLNTKDIERAREIIAQYSELYCEPCSGSGMHLLEQAKNNPQAFFIGFELRYKRAFRTVEKAQKARINNILILRTDAKQITDVFLPESFSGFFINFPDPWAKKHWKKNRLITAEYLQQMAGCLKHDGFFSYKTDHAEYFEETVSLIENCPTLQLNVIHRDVHQSESTDFQTVWTEFEKLFVSKNLPIYALRAQKQQ